MNYFKIFSFLFCLCIQTFLLSVTTYTISEFGIQELEQGSKKELISSHACQINNLGQVVGDYSYIEKNNSSPLIKRAIFTWNKDTGFKTIIEDTEYKRFPVINDAGIVAWSTFSGTGTGASAYLWDTISEQIKSIPKYSTNIAMVNSINNDNELLMSSCLVKFDLINPVNSVSICIDAYSFYREKCKNTLKSGEEIKYFIDKNKGFVAINNHSKVIGFFDFYYNTSPLYSHGFIWSLRSGIKDLGNGIQPSDINDSEQVVGCAKNCAFLWENEKLSIIVSNARAIAINNLGNVVGNMKLQANSSKETAFIFTEGIVHDLLSLVVDNDGWSSLEHAADINDIGQIVGYGYRHGKLTAFLLTPNYF